MKKLLVKYFALSNTEFNGIWVLILLIVSVFVSAEAYQYFMSQDGFSIEKWKDSTILRVEKTAKFQTTVPHKNTIKSVQFYDFDPNTAQISTWMDFGLSAKQAQSILNYLAKGGKFYKKEDVRKMFVISADLYQKLEPHIVIQNRERGTAFNTNSPTYPKSNFVPKVLEINSADTAELKQLKGIGSVFASRIVKYRNRLGGFHQVSQLKEVYGMSDTLYEKLKPFVKLDKDKLQKINVNSATFNELKKLPYWNAKQIQVLLEYRKQHGAFSSEKDLEKIVVLSPEILQKVAPYLRYDELRNH